MDSTETSADQNSSSPSDASPAPQPPFPLHIQVSGLVDEAKAREVGNFVGDLVRQTVQIGFDLSSLEKIVLTDAYADELGKVDRGFETSEQLTATTEDFASGVAMVVHVKRNDKLKCEMVVHVGLAVSALYGEDEAIRKMSTASLFHEMMHVHDFGRQCQMMPDMMFARVPKNLDGWLYGTINATWSEYFATYFAAPLDEAALHAYSETLVNALESFLEQVRTAIISYRTNGDLESLLDFVRGRFGALFKFAGYVIGHLEGMNKWLEELRPDDLAKIERLGFVPALTALRTELIKMHDAYPKWTGLEVYRGLGEVLRTYLVQQGIVLEPKDEGFRVNIPFTRETIPENARFLFDLGFPMGKQ